jgi:hypothetical protein
MKTYGGVEVYFHILDLGTRWRSRQLHGTGRFTPGEKAPVPIGFEADWTPEPVWTLWSREKSLAPVSIRTPAVAMPTMPTERLMNDQLEIICKETVVA